ncbi:50S ribosomal protein L11 methyltransferase [Amphiplicatus metriothermophilus]|uniref:Ribosomal protein L11 methyltransferase n=1 Tax=Amphiplicatus metriothermophilus TaxID=1519374 RepID=A0A239PUI0_9PROT|nr:50S ribosomal protein L11 methyltransferase [Amphiplicatus metriothermophilus]MBB5519268.1 ribosomal protein L11 methyltransferase [Amphiplicatus metriothermophilus]SNT73337.1 [LSU ribosomal protein L11P]-lysine N-methyltransferase [Amphiplicatus metriothermophilus]
MTACKLIWTGPRARLEAIETALTEVLWPPARAVSLTKAEPAAEDDETDWRLDAYFEEPPDGDALGALLAGIDGAGAPQIESVPDIDWVAHSLSGLGIVRCGRFVVYGVHDADKLPNEPGLIPIRIDANQAFGTGHHPTTSGCLTLLDRLAGLPPERVLDLGTGSAVLAIAAAKLWGRPAIASDIDETSVAIARENAALNSVAELVTVVRADGFDHPEIARAAPFDFVFANILAGPLVEFAPAMAAHVKPAGRAMLAGLTAAQEEAVTQAYEAAGFRRLNRLDHPVWPALLFARV